MSDEHERFARERQARVVANASHEPLRAASQAWLEHADAAKYEYNFEWMGRPIIQYPQDIVALQEIIWHTRPEVIVETGIAHGGTTIFYASMLRLLGPAPAGRPRRLVSVDIELRPHNRAAIEAHPMFDPALVSLLEGSSVDPSIVAQVHALAAGHDVLLCLDSNHAHAHVLEELRAYAPLVGKGSYIVVFDTSIASLEGGGYPGRPWGAGDNPRTAVAAFLAEDRRFVVDQSLEDRLLITSAPGGFLRCVEERP